MNLSNQVTVKYMTMVVFSFHSTHIAKWDMHETQGGGPFEEILQYDIFVNCINLMKVQSTIFFIALELFANSVKVNNPANRIVDRETQF